MVQNKRLLPFVSATASSGTGATLTIKLTPRTSSDVSVPLSEVIDGGFQLSGTQIAPIMKPVAINVAGQKNPVSRGLCSVTLIETYQLGSGAATARSKWDVIKRKGGDVDLFGHAV
jgi:hypothetical protein